MADEKKFKFIAFYPNGKSLKGRQVETPDGRMLITKKSLREAIEGIEMPDDAVLEAVVFTNERRDDEKYPSHNLVFSEKKDAPAGTAGRPRATRPAVNDDDDIPF